MSSDRTGGCLCGAVTYRLTDSLADVLHCHCENCRRITGNFVAAAHIATSAIDVADPDGLLAWYRLPYARYGFCRGCSSTLFWVSAEDEATTSLMVGSLDSPAGLRLGGVWLRPKPRAIMCYPTTFPISTATAEPNTDPAGLR